MRILVTGANGFLGKNLCVELKNRGYLDILEYDKETDPETLDSYLPSTDFIFHLAGVNRPQNDTEFMEGNFGFTSILLEKLKTYGNKCPIMIASSIQALLDNPYGKSKRAGEDLLFQYHEETGSNILIYRFPNIFGKWARPNYNSAIATFCYNIANDLPIQVRDPNALVNLVYIDDVIDELINALENKENRTGLFCEVAITYTKSLSDIVNLIYSFKSSREDKSVPYMSDAFAKKLYSTYLSYLPTDRFGYELSMNVDQRGSFTEFIKTSDRGQISINVSKPGIVKGNHWHHTKNEKFLVVSGKGVIRFRNIFENRILEYYVNGEKLEVIDIPVGYTHNIENLGETEMVTVMWANETFDPNNPDTFYLEV